VTSHSNMPAGVTVNIDDSACCTLATLGGRSGVWNRSKANSR